MAFSFNIRERSSDSFNIIGFCTLLSKAAEGDLAAAEPAAAELKKFTGLCSESPELVSALFQHSPSGTEFLSLIDASRAAPASSFAVPLLYCLSAILDTSVKLHTGTRAQATRLAAELARRGGQLPDTIPPHPTHTAKIGLIRLLRSVAAAAPDELLASGALSHPRVLQSAEAGRSRALPTPEELPRRLISPRATLITLVASLTAPPLVPGLLRGRGFPRLAAELAHGAEFDPAEKTADILDLVGAVMHTPGIRPQQRARVLSPALLRALASIANGQLQELAETAQGLFIECTSPEIGSSVFADTVARDWLPRTSLLHAVEAHPSLASHITLSPQKVLSSPTPETLLLAGAVAAAHREWPVWAAPLCRRLGASDTPASVALFAALAAAAAAAAPTKAQIHDLAPSASALFDAPPSGPKLMAVCSLLAVLAPGSAVVPGFWKTISANGNALPADSPTIIRACLAAVPASQWPQGPLQLLLSGATPTPTPEHARTFTEALSHLIPAYTPATTAAIRAELAVIYGYAATAGDTAVNDIVTYLTPALQPAFPGAQTLDALARHVQTGATLANAPLPPASASLPASAVFTAAAAAAAAATAAAPERPPIVEVLAACIGAGSGLRRPAYLALVADICPDLVDTASTKANDLPTLARAAMTVARRFSAALRPPPSAAPAAAPATAEAGAGATEWAPPLTLPYVLGPIYTMVDNANDLAPLDALLAPTPSRPALRAAFMGTAAVNNVRMPLFEILLASLGTQTSLRAECVAWKAALLLAGEAPAPALPLPLPSLPLGGLGEDVPLPEVSVLPGSVIGPALLDLRLDGDDSPDGLSRAQGQMIAQALATAAPMTSAASVTLVPDTLLPSTGALTALFVAAAATTLPPTHLHHITAPALATSEILPSAFAAAASVCPLVRSVGVGVLGRVAGDAPACTAMPDILRRACRLGAGLGARLPEDGDAGDVVWEYSSRYVEPMHALFTQIDDYPTPDPNPLLAAAAAAAAAAVVASDATRPALRRWLKHFRPASSPAAAASFVSNLFTAQFSRAVAGAPAGTHLAELRLAVSLFTTAATTAAGAGACARAGLASQLVLLAAAGSVDIRLRIKALEALSVPLEAGYGAAAAASRHYLHGLLGNVVVAVALEPELGPAAARLARGLLGGVDPVNSVMIKMLLK